MGLLLDCSADVPVEVGGEDADEEFAMSWSAELDSWTMSPGGEVLVRLPNASHDEAWREPKHLEIAETTARSAKEICGFEGPPLVGWRNHVAWHPTMVKSSTIYALAAGQDEYDVHLIDAKLHKRLMTWTSKYLVSILENFSMEDPPELAWSTDGTKLAIVSATGTIVLPFQG